jgi:hypothetical protein
MAKREHKIPKKKMGGPKNEQGKGGLKKEKRSLKRKATTAAAARENFRPLRSPNDPLERKNAARHRDATPANKGLKRNFF